MIPTPTITDKGIIAPTTDEILQGLWAVFVSAFGTDLNQTLNTPQGQLITSETASLRDRDDQLIYLMNQIDPQYATGIWQDAIAKLYFLTRQAATKSTAQVVFSGLSGSIIPKGFLIQDQAGNLWATTASATILPSGNVTATVECQTVGAISASANTITKIVTALAGVDRVTNPSAAVIGSDQESRVDFETRRALSVSANAKNTDASVRGTIANLPNVVDVWVQSNPQAVAATFGSTNYPVDAHSILVSVVGGIDYDIAWQILVKAGTGCSFMGNTTVTVTDTDTYPLYPPQYAVKFLRPTNTPIYFQLQLEDKSKMSYNDQLNINNKIINAMATGTTRARIGQLIRAAQYIPIIANVIPNLNIFALKISLNGTTWVDTLSMGVDQFPTVSAINITVI